MAIAMLHICRTLTSGCRDDIMVDSESDEGGSSPPSRGLEIVGVQGRVHEMVLRFSVSSSGLYFSFIFLKFL